MFKLIATMLSATIAALAGMMLVLYEKSATYELLSINLTIQALLMTIIGGVGTLSGPLIGAAVVRLLDQWLDGPMLQSMLPSWLRTDLLFGLIYVALVLFFPAGIVGALHKFVGVRSLRTAQVFRRAWTTRPADAEQRNG